jgi:hypothetical protein
MFQQSCGAVCCQEWAREIQMQAGIDSMLACQHRGAFRILRENHGAHRGDGSAEDTIKSLLGSLLVPPPVVGIHDQTARRNCQPIASCSCNGFSATGRRFDGTVYQGSRLVKNSRRRRRCSIFRNWMNSAETSISFRLAMAQRYPARHRLPLNKTGRRVIW